MIKQVGAEVEYDAITHSLNHVDTKEMPQPAKHRYRQQYNTDDHDAFNGHGFGIKEPLQGFFENRKQGCLRTSEQHTSQNAQR